MAGQAPLKWFAGSDHAGYDLKVALVTGLRSLGDDVIDLGTDSATRSVDYPDFGYHVARAVAREPHSRGLLVCGTGIGVSIAANRVAGIRAARVTDAYSARMARWHNDANVLCLGQRVTGVGLAEDFLRAFRETEFEGGRHQARVDKLDGAR